MRIVPKLDFTVHLNGTLERHPTSFVFMSCIQTTVPSSLTAERLTLDQEVEGSNPSWAAGRKKRYYRTYRFSSTTRTEPSEGSMWRPRRCRWTCVNSTPKNKMIAET